MGTVIALGIPGYLVFFSAGRNLSGTDFATFVVFWTLINTVLLGVFSPIEAVGPYLRSRKPEEKDFNDKTKALTSAGLIIAASIALVTEIALIPNLLNGPLIVISCVVSYSIFNYIRTKEFANHKLHLVFLNSLLYLLIFAASLAVVDIFLPEDICAYLLCLPIAWAGSSAASLALSRKNEKSAVNKSKHFDFPFLIRTLRPRFEKKYLILSASSFISFLPLSAGLILAKENLASEETFNSYVGIVMLTRLGLTIVNSVTPIFVLRYNRISLKKNLFMLYFFAHIGVFFLAALIACSVFLNFGDLLLKIFLNTNLAITPFEIILVVLGECLLASTVAPKTQLIARGVSKAQFAPWVLGSTLYIFIVNAEEGVEGLGLASLIAATTVIALQLKELVKNAT